MHMRERRHFLRHRRQWQHVMTDIMELSRNESFSPYFYFVTMVNVARRPMTVDCFYLDPMLSRRVLHIPFL